MAAPSGILAFDVPELLAPVNRCLVAYQQKIIEEELDTMDVLQKDPVPQYTIDQIKEATDFLTAANQAMQEFANGFKPTAVTSLSTDQLSSQRDYARESWRRLGLLFSESEPFSGNRMKGDLVRIKEVKQSDEVRCKLKSLRHFLEEFGQACWLGQILQTCDFQTKIQLCTNLLAGLLAPRRACLDTSKVESRMFEVEKTTSAAGLSNAQQARFEHLRARAISASLSSQSEALAALFGSERRSFCTTSRTQSHNCKNPLLDIEEELDAGLRTSADCVKMLEKMCNKLKTICKEDAETRAEVRRQHHEKMACLLRLAEELNRVPVVLNQYLLVRLGEINQADVKVLKAWISEEEADGVHKMLGKFCDEATEERAFRRMCEAAERARPAAPSPSTAS